MSVPIDRPWLIVGGGGHGQVVADMLLMANADVRGIIDPGIEVGHRFATGLQILGGDELLERDFYP